MSTKRAATSCWLHSRRQTRLSSWSTSVQTRRTRCVERERISHLALKNRLPLVSGISGYADAGGLLTYGARQTDLYLRAAVFVDRILKGARPANLPIEHPSSFELVLNLKTAKSLGVAIPDSVRWRADRLIE